MIDAKKIIVIGLVQGVGFRPFIHRIAVKYGLNGYVRNIGGSEVEIWVEGDPFKIRDFIEEIRNNHPPPAIIEEIIISQEKPRGYTGFRILKSGKSFYKRSNIPPDFAICEHCLREILDPSDRRYRYAFNSCAWCGPRFSMIYRIPYDRENTSMVKYKLCEECLREYNDLNNIRRYHAQGISCPIDGPRLYLYDNKWNITETSDPIKTVAKLIDEGHIVAVKGIGGYHIAALATNDDVVLKLRKRKKRPTKPFAIMGLDTSVLEKIVYIDDKSRKILESPQAPILLLPKKEDSPVSRYVSPGLSHEGVFVAYTGLHYLLLMETRDKFLIMTSGNKHGEPMCTDEKCAKEKLSDIVDYFLVHDREIVNRVDDSVLRWTGGNLVFLRRSRGYAPLWIRIGVKLRGEYIAFGADLSTAGAIGFDDKIILTQYIGDIDEPATMSDMMKYIEFFVKNYHIDENKAFVVVDKHPRYNSRLLGLKYAEEKGLRVFEIQHHYAHVLGAAVDNGVKTGVAAGLAIDGTGYGDDGKIWGGEVILFDPSRPWYKRAASLSPLPIVSDRDAYYPVRILVSYLSSKGYDWEEIRRILESRNLLDKVPHGEKELRLVHSLALRNQYTDASSTGRLLDLFSVLLDVGYNRTYEGELAIKLEATAFHGRVMDDPGYRIVLENGTLQLDYSSVIDNLLNALPMELPVEDYARTLLYWLGYYYGELIVSSIKGTCVEKVVVSGGAAVNSYVIEGLETRLDEDGLEILLPKRIPPGDGGIAFGQIIAASLLNS